MAERVGQLAVGDQHRHAPERRFDINPAVVAAGLADINPWGVLVVAQHLAVEKPRNALINRSALSLDTYTRFSGTVSKAA